MTNRDPLREPGEKLSFARLLSLGIDLLYPPRCAGCGRVGTAWCERCQDALNQAAVDLKRVRLSPDFIIAATGIHEGKLQQAVHALKYTRALDLAAPLGDRLIYALSALNWTIDTIIPVPLHTARQRARGIINHNS